MEALIIIRAGHGDPSSNPHLGCLHGCLHGANTLTKGMHLIILLPAIGK